jgi:Flp pilus assembly protein TadD
VSELRARVVTVTQAMQEAAAHQKAGRADLAAEIYRQVVDHNPNNINARHGLGLALRNLYQTNEAIAVLKHGIATAPQHPEMHHTLGLALADLGLFDEAAESYRCAIALKPEFTEALNNLGNALADPREALEVYREAIKQPTAAAYFNMHGPVLDLEGPEQAIECLRRAVDLEPEAPRYRFFAGMMLDYFGDTGAADHLDRARRASDEYRAKVDAWEYLRDIQPRPRIIGTPATTFCAAVDAAPSHGLVLEFGVRFGASIRQIAALVGTQQVVHGFDSFQGLPEAWNGIPLGAYTTAGVLPTVPRNVTLHVGWFNDTLPGFMDSNPGPVRLANIDCDIYSSTATVLTALAPRIEGGSILVFDELVGNETWRQDEFRALQEAAERYSWRYRYLTFSFYSKQAVVQILP